MSNYKCKYCSQPAIYYRRISNEYVCQVHFIKTIEKKVRRTIRKYELIGRKDKIVVGVSGGKDSLALLYNLIQIQKKRPQAPPIEAILIDEGISNYRWESIEIAKKICESWNVELHIVSFEREFGSSLDNVIPKLDDLKINACTICGTVRRRLLNQKALELQADKLAIGHNLDDQAETFMQNILRNDLNKIVSNPPYGNPPDPTHQFVPRIKPLMWIPESEITLFCYYLGIPIQSNPCPYVEEFSILRKKVQDFINLLDIQSPETKYNLLNANESLIIHLQKLNLEIEKDEFLKENDEIKVQNLRKCKICNSYCGPKRKICYYCELKHKLDI